MAESGDNQHDWSSDSDPNRTLVEDGANRRPFMRGIVVHSLMARGIPFEEAYRTADRIRERLRGRPVIPKEVLSSPPFPRPPLLSSLGTRWAPFFG